MREISAPALERAAIRPIAADDPRDLRVSLREFPSYRLDSVSNRADLEHSCSPVYSRGLSRQVQSAFAVLGLVRRKPSLVLMRP